MVALRSPGSFSDSDSSPLLSVTDSPSILAEELRDDDPVESRMMDPPEIVAAPMSREAIPPGVTPRRVIEDPDEPEMRTIAPFPLPGVTELPRVMSPGSTEPVPMISESSASVSLPRAVRMMSFPVRGEPELSRVRFPVEVVTVTTPWFWVRMPPIRSDSAA